MKTLLSMTMIAVLLLASLASLSRVIGQYGAQGSGVDGTPTPEGTTPESFESAKVIYLPFVAGGQLGSSIGHGQPPDPALAKGGITDKESYSPDEAHSDAQLSIPAVTSGPTMVSHAAGALPCELQAVAHGVQLCIDRSTNAHAILVDLNDPHVSVQTVLPMGPNGECNSVNGPDKDSTSNCSSTLGPYPLERLDSMFQRYKAKGAVAIINTDYFGCGSQYPCGGTVAYWGAQGLAVRNGVRLDGQAHNDNDDGNWNGSTKPSLAISDSKAPVIGVPGSEVAIDSQLLTTYRNAVGGAPIIVENGQVVNTDCPGDYPDSYSCSRSAQSAAGVTDGEQLILASANIGTEGIAYFLKNNFSVKTALKFDGGGSAHIGWLGLDGTFKDYRPGGENRPVAEALIIFSSPVGDSVSVTDVPNPDVYQCSQPGHVDFEGFPDTTDLTSGTISGLQFTTTGGYTWVVGDWATGKYNGKYPAGGYTSGGTRWAWLGPNQGAGRIVFPKGPASFFSLLVSTNTPVSLDTYDQYDNLLATTGPAPYTYGTGHMTELKVTRAKADMAYVVVHDRGNYFLVDEICTNAAQTPNTIKRIADQTYPMQTGQSVFGSFIVDLFAGFRTFLHIFIGPFHSDVDLRLIRPDGSQVQPDDSGVIFNNTSTFVEVFIEDAAAGEWRYEIIANELDPGGEYIRIRVDEEAFLISSGLPTLTVPGNQTVQYSDALYFDISATDPDDPAGSLTFSASELPSGLALTDHGDGTATVAGTVVVAPGTYSAQLTATDPNGLTDTKTVSIVVMPEDARATYTGALHASTSGVTSPDARVTLAATVQDITAIDPSGDPEQGDIRNATLTFVNRDSGVPLCTARIGLLYPSDSKTGTTTCNWDLTITGDSQSFTIGIVVAGYYTRDVSADNTVVTVAKPLAGSFITGGGYLLLSKSAGQKAADAGTKNNFGFNIKYNKSGRNLQGNINTIFRRTEMDGILHTYQVKGNVMNSLSVDPSRGTAVFNGKASIQDITDPLIPISVDGNATLQVNLTDRGEPGTNDSVAITIWNKTGGLWFASAWNGTQTVEDTLSSGNAVVR